MGKRTIRAFAEIVRDARKARGLRQVDVADQLGISAQYLNDVERGRRNVPPVTLIPKLAHVLGIEQDVLLYLAGKLPPDRPMDAPPERIQAAFAALRAVITPGKSHSRE